VRSITTPVKSDQCLDKVEVLLEQEPNHLIVGDFPKLKQSFVVLLQEFHLKLQLAWFLIRL
jgi:hypothetical protein